MSYTAVHVTTLPIQIPPHLEHLAACIMSGVPTLSEMVTTLEEEFQISRQLHGKYWTATQLSGTNEVTENERLEFYKWCRNIFASLRPAPNWWQADEFFGLFIYNATIKGDQFLMEWIPHE